MIDRIGTTERYRGEVYSPKRMEEMDVSLARTIGDSRSVVVVHTRPMLPEQRPEDWRSHTQVMEIVSVGDGEGVCSLDTDAGSTPDLPFTSQSLALLQRIVETSVGEKLTIIAPYIKYAPQSWESVIHSLEEDQNIALVAVDPKHLQLIEGKRYFESIMEESGVAISPALEFSDVNDFRAAGGWDLARRTFGFQFVVQINDSAGGSGTKLVGVDHGVEEAEEMISQSADGWFKITRFHNGYETNGAAVVLPGGQVYIDPLSRKPVAESIRKAFGGKKAGAVGDDWSLPWPDSVQHSYIDVMVKTGRHLHSKYGYVGIFGIDSIVNNKVEPHEINARPQGTTRHHHMRAQILGRPSTWYLHILSLAGHEDFSWLPDPDIWNSVVASETGGWQVDIVPRENEIGKVVGRNTSGRYSWTEGLVQDDSGSIWLVAPKEGQVLDWKNKKDGKRLTSHGQIYYVPANGVKPLPSIFDTSEQRPSEFGIHFADRLREVLWLE